MERYDDPIYSFSGSLKSESDHESEHECYECSVRSPSTESDQESDNTWKTQNEIEVLNLDQRMYDLILSEEQGLSKLFFEHHKEKLIFHNDDFYMYDVSVKTWLKKSSDVIGLEMCRFLEPIIKQFTKKWMPKTTLDNSKVNKQENPFPKILTRFINKNVGTMSMVRKLKPLIEKTQEKQDTKDFIFNQDYHHLIPVKDGKVINLKTGLKEDGKPEYKFDLFLDLEIERDEEKIEFIDQVMMNICCGDKELFRYLQVMLGYMITGETKEQTAFIWYGSGRNGKSTVISLLKKVLGKFYGELPEHLIINKESSRFKDSDSVSPAVIKLKDSRVAILTETKKAEEINDKIVKRITGGEVLEGRSLFKDITYFQPKFKPVICSNFKPKVDIQDYALMRRMVLFPFNAKFVEKPVHPNEYTVDKDLTSKLNKEYLNAFFTWLCEGAEQYYKSGLPERTQLMKDEMNTFVQDNQNEDDIQDWLDENCEPSSQVETKGTDLFQCYRNWYLISRPDRNHKKDKEFYKILRQKNIQTKIKNNATWFSGIKIKI